MQRVGVIERAVAAADARAPWRWRAGHSRARARPPARPRDPAPARRRSPRPACSRCRACGGCRSAALAPDAMPGCGREHVVHRVAGEMPALQQHRAAAERQQSVGRVMHRRARSSMRCPARISASGRFGVSTAARGTRRRFSASIAAGLDQRRAAFRDHDRIDDERDTCGARSASTAATVSMTAASCSMPVLIASAPISSSTTSICCRMNSGGIGNIAENAQRCSAPSAR